MKKVFQWKRITYFFSHHLKEDLKNLVAYSYDTLHHTWENMLNNNEFWTTDIISFRKPLCFWFCNHTTGFQVEVSDAACHGEPPVNVRLAHTVPRHETTQPLDP